ncbi:lipopolysaccharide transport system ATP-binding protein [Lutibacter oceani]|uniref:Lipopolysaccharide transport system ATP-binding protein n=1 Tax=Lutibacter oceani TaxID=1853311 RepID=A0A3D9RQ20_9FLAO|nr:ABC transporter ATP-binding protein [Lutibacter oceani]REE82000.1 lipopolysaccharide transport system ATP-binding protein [Lutibacter oceani]
MSEIILKIENLSKQYRLGTVGTGTLSHDLNRWWHKVRGKEDPFLKIGDVNNRATKGTSEYVWALKDINIEVKKGEVLGIIGKNGAGKSTLLKILSKVTGPTTGSIKSRGRIASLLEVGTGFHPELTGRENIFLNGAILGMTKTEINAKYDEIVEFSGCERYIDTPVKRYSSGMRVRLAFAVAAFLEPDILVIDEVLAVGDAEFQKKAIGKMQDISKGEGRTVLFVSHNMDAILKLTTRAIVLENGKVVFTGSTDEAVKNYISLKNSIKINKNWDAINEAPGNLFARLKKISVLNNANIPNYDFDVSEDIFILIDYWDFNIENKNTAIIQVFNEYDVLLFSSNEFNSPIWETIHNGNKAVIKTKCKIPSNFLTEGKYSVLVAIGNYNPNRIHIKIENALTFSVRDNFIEGVETVKKNIGGNWPGIIRPLLKWEITKEI